MEKLCLFAILVIISTQALGMSYRNRRQAEDEGGLEDRYGWMYPSGRFPQRPWRPNPNPNLFPNPNLNQGQTTTTTTAPVTTPGTNPTVFTLTPELRQCRSTCPTTAEYNPVCGTNLQTYDNPSRLFCDQACGVTVSQLRSSRCPGTVAAN